MPADPKPPKVDKRKSNPQPPGGSRKGCPNRTSAAIKDAILHAFEEVGGQEYLVMVANTDPKVFCALLAKVLPSEVKAEVTGKLTLADLVAGIVPAE